jgi:flagellar basal body P-ring protein FlgI
MPPPLLRRSCQILILSYATLAILPLSGCSGDGKSPEQRFVRPVTPVLRQVPDVLRGTLASEAQINGASPVAVSGLGLVVGLDGTGGGPYPAAVISTMERELAIRGISANEPGPLAGMSPRAILNDKNVAVVVVEGLMPPGVPQGANFDVRVRALPGSTTSSLEGGTLWTCDLRQGPPTTFGRPQGRVIGKARGPVFLNPFAEGGSRQAGDGDPELAGGSTASADGVVRTSGRVLGGGVITEALMIQVVLDNPTLAKITTVRDSINTRFSPEPGQQEPTARGASTQTLTVRVPPSYRQSSDEFLATLLAMRTDPSFPQEAAKKYVDALKDSGSLADELSSCLVAVGQPSVPFLMNMYDHPQSGPRMAALRAGARLGDVRAGPFLRDVALSASEPTRVRAEAAELLGLLSPTSSSDAALRELASADDVQVRVSAYQSMLRRGDPTLGVARIDNRFAVIAVPSDRPMIYVTQQDQPRIVLFGAVSRGAQVGAGAMGMPLVSPTLASWNSDRLLLACDGTGEPLRMLYRSRSGQQILAQSQPDVMSMISVLARKPRPEDERPGFGLSYSEVVGVLYALQQAGGVAAEFVIERDRFVERLIAAGEGGGGAQISERRESNQRADDAENRAKVISGIKAPQPVDPARRTWVVPLNPGTSPQQEKNQSGQKR